MELSNYVSKYAREFGTNPNASIAIAMQESSLINQDRMGAILTKEGKTIRGVTDVGVFQIHIDTIENMRREGWDIDVQRLRTDVEYQTYWHVRLLKKKIQTCRQKQERLGVVTGDEWSCYHSYTPAKRQVYLQMVSRHLAKLD